MAIHFFGECLFEFKLKRQEARDTRFLRMTNKEHDDKKISTNNSYFRKKMLYLRLKKRVI